MNIKLIDNLSVASECITSVETVALKVFVKTGSRDEAEENNGISHFLEHMAFKGTERRSAIQIAEEFDMIGGDFNAYTSRESTVYYAKVLKQDISTAVDILADIVQNSVFDTKEIDKERRVILEELAQTRDTPDDYIFELFQEQIFPDQAIGRSILGTEEFIRSVTKNELVNYTAKKYSRDNIIIACAGNFENDHLISLIDREFRSLPISSTQRQLNAQYIGGVKLLQKDLEQVHLLIGFPGVSYLDNEFYQHQILSIILGGGMSSRLYQAVREQRGLAYHISAFTSHYQDNGIFSIYSASNEIHVIELISIIAEQMKTLCNNITEVELQRAKSQIKSNLLMAQENSSYRAGRIASSYAIFGKIIPLDEIVKKIDDVTISDLKNVLLKMLKKHNSLTFTAIGKVNHLKSLDQIQKTFAID